MSETPPNPPITDPVSPYESLNSRKLHEAAERALDHYLAPAHIMATPYSPSSMFLVNHVKKPPPGEGGGFFLQWRTQAALVAVDVSSGEYIQRINECRPLIPSLIAARLR